MQIDSPVVLGTLHSACLLVRACFCSMTLDIKLRLLTDLYLGMISSNPNPLTLILVMCVLLGTLRLLVFILNPLQSFDHFEKLLQSK